jgi:hypothetical protein
MQPIRIKQSLLRKTLYLLSIIVLLLFIFSDSLKINLICMYKSTNVYYLNNITDKKLFN